MHAADKRFRLSTEPPKVERAKITAERITRDANSAGDVVSRADIAEHVWDEHYDPLSNVVDVYIQRLRRKLDAAGVASLIRTRRGEGYQLFPTEA